MNNLPNKTKRIILMVSGGIDALIGSFLLLVGFGLLPIDIVGSNWLVILLGGIFFVLGVGTIAYNLSRLEE